MTVQMVTGRDPYTGKSRAVHFCDGRITAITDGPRAEVAWLAPGLIDLQVNGFYGEDCNADDLSIETLRHLAQRMASTGVTTFLPTLITASEEKIRQNLSVIAAARKENSLLRHMVPYVHVEGPHLSIEDGPRGAHPRGHIRPPSISEFDRWQVASGGLVGLVTLSPHYSEAPEYIRALVQRGVHVALGHSSATAEQIRAAVVAGARLSTHLGNGVASSLPRHPNLLWAQLAEDRLIATFIADGHHLPLDTLVVMLRAKTIARSILVSDLVMLAGMPAGKYKTPVGDAVELQSNGRLNVLGTPYLAGATSTLAEAIAYVASHTEFTLADAIQMTTENPGRFVHNRGKLCVGADADMIRFYWDKGSARLQIQQVIVRGEIQ
jgi:N-acetylglucosamine-6-phosphate deacetylase